MRVAVIHPSYPLQTFAVVETNALRAQGVDVIPVNLRGGARLLSRLQHEDPFPERIVPVTFDRRWLFSVFAFVSKWPGWSVRELCRTIAENWSDPGHLSRTLFVFFKAPAIVRLVDERKVDLVHIFWGHYPSGIAPFLRKAFPSLPITIGLGAYTLQTRPPSLPRWVEHIDAIATMYEGYVGIIRNEWPISTKPVAVIHRGTDLERLRAQQPEARDRNQIVLVSRLLAIKTVADAIRAFALVLTAHPKARMHIIGDGDERRALERLAEMLQIAERIAFHGNLPHRETLRMVARSRLLVLSSLYRGEAFPNVIKEAMALGVPSVSYDISGVRDFVVNGGEIHLAPAGDIDALANAIADVLDDDALHARIVASADRRIANFDVKTTANRQAELFATLIARAPLPDWVCHGPPDDPGRYRPTEVAPN